MAMEEWSLSPEGPPASAVEILAKLQGLGLCSHIDASSDDESTASSPRSENLCLFDRILRVFMKNIDERQKIPPLPALLGNGTPVDLFRLYRAVGKKGGYYSVSADRSWASVAEEIGYDLQVSSSLKVIYFKYLGALNPWLQKVLDGYVLGSRECLSSSVGESEVEADGSFCKVLDQEKDGCEPKSQADDGGSSNGDVVILDPVMGNRVFSSIRWKQEALARMLDWVLRVAKNPGDHSMGGVSSEKDKDKVHGVGGLMFQVLMARNAMYLKTTHINDDGSPSQKRQKIHPSTYEDDNGLDTNESQKLRCSGRLNAANRHSHSGSSSEMTTIRDQDWDKGLMTVADEGKCDKRRLRSFSSLTNVVAGLLSRNPLQKRIPVGPSFQVKVPEWTARAAVTSGDSDELKWLGTRIWPPKRKTEAFAGWIPIGECKQDRCACASPGSVECIRFHVAEKRLHLKCELHSAFRDWGFNCMGEEVALSWTEKEERRFKAIVRLNPPSINKNFWDQLYLSFPCKGRQNLVSYYFNVFLLRRRSYQNRVTPDSVDSDEEERDYGFLSRSLSHDAVKAWDPNTIFCAQNVQYVNLTDSSDSD